MAYSGTPNQPVEGFLSSGWGAVSGPIASSSRLPQVPHRTNQASSMFGAANLANQVADCAPSKRRNSRSDSGHLAKKPRTGEPQMTMVSYQQQHSSSSLIPSPNASLSVNPYTHDDGEHRVQINQITNHYHSVNIQHAVNPNFGANYGNFTQAVHITSSTSDAQKIDDLPRNRDASGLLSEYLEGSRDKETQAVYEWIKSSPELVLWVHAPAGLGKSTFARHLGEDLRDKGQLAAALFMSFTPGNMGPETVIKLIAGEIARIHPLAVPSVVEAIKNSSGSGLSCQRLLNDYVKIPIQSLNLPHPLIVLMDAADEWASHQRFLEQLAPLESSREIVKFIVFTRTTPRLSDFPGVSIQPQPLPPASEDVLVQFFNHHFTKVRWQGEPPSEQQVTKLAEKASGIFVWAWTVLSLINDDFVDAPPKEFLEQTLHSHRTIGDSDLLAQLYYGSIRRSFPDPKHHEHVRKYLEAIFVLEKPLPVTDFSELIDMKDHIVKNIRRGLRALQTRDPDDSTKMVYPAASIFHLSVMEYFQSSSTARVHAFNISTVAGHAVIGGGCLALLPKLFPANPQYIALDRNQGLFKYVTTTWPSHVANSFPPLATNPDPEKWINSEVYDALENVDFEVVEKWATALMSGIMIWGEETESLLHSLGEHLSRDHALKSADLGVACLELAVRLLPDDAEYWCALGEGHIRQASARTCRRSAEAASAIQRHALKVSATVDFEANKDRLKCSLAHTLASDVWYETGSGSCVPKEMEEAVLMARQGVELANSDEERERWLATLSLCLAARFLVTIDLEGLQESTKLGGETPKPRSEGHSGREAPLSNPALSSDKRFKMTACLADLEESIKFGHEALKLPPENQSSRSRLPFLLALLYNKRFGLTACLADLEESIKFNHEAVKLWPEGPPEFLEHLALLYHSRFEVTACLADLEESIKWYGEALKLRPESHPSSSDLLVHLALSYDERFEVTACLGDLEESIKWHGEALKLRPESHPSSSDFLVRLALSYSKRFEVTACLGDLEESIKLRVESLKLLPEGHVGRSALLSSLALSYDKRFEVTACLRDLEECIKLHGEALELRPEGHVGRSASLSNLALSYDKRFEVTACLRDLEESIKLRGEALELRPEGHPSRSGTLDDLALSFCERFRVTACLGDLEESIKLHREALRLRPEGHVDRSDSLYSLAISFYERFLVTACLGDLEESIELHGEALELRPEGHVGRATSLSILARLFHQRSEVTACPADLEESIKFSHEALKLSTENLLSSASLSLLALSLYKRFEATECLGDLNEGIELCQEALKLLPKGHASRPDTLSQLVILLDEHFKRTNCLGDLEESIRFQREALELCPEGHSGRSHSLSNLASSLDKRFKATKCLGDLEESIKLFRKALDLQPEGHSRRPGTLSNLALSYNKRFRVTKCLGDLEEGIQLRREALKLHPESHPNHLFLPYALAVALEMRFGVTARLSDLEESIALHRDVLRSRGNHDRYRSLWGLGWTLYLRFNSQRQLGDLYEAIAVTDEALELCPSDAPADRRTLETNKSFLLDTLASFSAS